MKKFSLEEKKKAVELVKAGLSFAEASRQTKISRWVIRDTMAHADKYGWDSLSKHRNDWSGEEKLHILKYKEDNHLSYFETSLQFGIKGSGTVYMWATQYRRSGMAGLVPKKRGGSNKKLPPEETMTLIEQLKAEIFELRAENEYLKKLAALIAKQERPERERKQKQSRN